VVENDIFRNDIFQIFSFQILADGTNEIFQFVFISLCRMTDSFQISKIIFSSNFSWWCKQFFSSTRGWQINLKFTKITDLPLLKNIHIWGVW
jgi:hypothetical protein